MSDARRREVAIRVRYLSVVDEYKQDLRKR